MDSALPVGDLYWVPHPILVWAPCSLDGEKVTFAIDGEGEKISISAADVLDISQCRTEQMEGVDDICSMAIVTEGAMLHTIRVRYDRSDIYTRVARILIAVNPFKTLSIFSSQYLQKYKNAADPVELPPHIFGIGQDALLGLRGGSQDQAILISGESGAGKTESAKLVLSFIAESSQQSQRENQESSLEDVMLQTNPVLEAFGNAMTVRNNNSSRFGKWMDITFSGALSISGCSIISYLLEVTRVCTQAEGERNYHIFFMLLQARKSTEFALSSMNLQEPHCYRYLKDCEATAPGISDSKCFEDLKEALTGLGFARELIIEIFSILAAILAYGNCDFVEKNDQAKLIDGSPMQEAAGHLHVSVDELTQCTLLRKLVVGRDVTETPLQPEQARRQRDSISRLIYGRLFLWLIDQMNASMIIQNAARQGSAHERQRLLGVLDIAGFESFAINSLEQLLINLSNEHLQQQFNHTVFKSELEDYANEDIVLTADIKFVDNSDVLMLLDGKGGVLDILDEEVTMPQTTDHSYVTKVLKVHGEHGRVVPPKFPGEAMFGIQHYAGAVKYTCDGFLEKNKDNPPEDLVPLFCSSSLQILQKVGQALETELKVTRDSRGKKVRTWSSGYRASLRSLMGKIRNAAPHYIRCVKPNREKVPNVFTSGMVFDQLLLSGVLETVHIRQQGFSSRLYYAEFVARYRCIATMFAKEQSRKLFKDGGKVDKPDMASRDLVTLFLDALKPGSGGTWHGPIHLTLDRKDFAYGKTKVFFRHHALQTLEIGRVDAIKEISRRWHRLWRTFKAGKKLVEMYRTKTVLRKWLRDNSVFGEKSVAAKGFAFTKGAKALTAADIQCKAITKLGSTEAVVAAMKTIAPILAKAEKLDRGNPLVVELMLTHAQMQKEIDRQQEIEEGKRKADSDFEEKKKQAELEDKKRAAETEEGRNGAKMDETKAQADMNKKGAAEMDEIRREADMEDKREAIGNAVKKKSVRISNISEVRKMSSTTEDSDASLDEAEFHNLRNYKGLKSKTKWSGHKDSMVCDPEKQACVHQSRMLCHCKMNIAEALTKVPANLESQALLNFRNIRIWMHDRPAQDCERNACREAVVSLATAEVELRSEIYVQTMKQMTANTSERSVLLGWELLAELCETAPPRTDLIEFLWAFLRDAAPELDIDVEAKQACEQPSQCASGSSSFACRCVRALRGREARMTDCGASQGVERRVVESAAVGSPAAAKEKDCRSEKPDSAVSEHASAANSTDNGCSLAADSNAPRFANQQPDSQLAKPDWQHNVIFSHTATTDESLAEVLVETRETFLEAVTGPLAAKGILARLQVVHQTFAVETRSVFVRKQSGEREFEYSDWQNAGAIAIHFQETSLEGIGQLRKMQAHNLKKNPSIWATIFSLGARAWLDRTCILIDGHFLWWEPGKENSADEGGCINFFLQSAEAFTDPYDRHSFLIKPALESGWEEYPSSSFGGGKNRVFSFRCEDSSVLAAEWVAAIRQHIEFCAEVRYQLGHQYLLDTIGIRKYKLSEVMY